MPPLPPPGSVLTGLAPSVYPRTHVAQSENTAPFFAAQRDSWRSPEDILTILMLIGGDIVQCAVAQLAGTGPWYFTPVAFSFGWVGYAVQALMSAIGTGRLMPEPDCSSQVINGKSGYPRDNQSWALGRLLRDHEQNKETVEANNGVKKVAALTIVFYEVKKIGKPARDWVYWAGVITILAQLGIALIPGLLHGNWLVLVVTGGGTLLALIGSGLPQWTEEKYAGRKVEKGRRDVTCITRGNGKNYVMVLISDGVGIRVEDMASGREKNSWKTSVCTAVLSVLWIVLLLTVEGLDGDAWYMLAVGGLGMVQNVVAAGARRSAAALGIHFEKGGDVATGKVMDALWLAARRAAALGIPIREGEKGGNVEAGSKVLNALLPAMRRGAAALGFHSRDREEGGEVVAGSKVMDALLLAELKEPGVGAALLPIYFPGGLRGKEVREWDELKESRKTREMDSKEEREKAIDEKQKEWDREEAAKKAAEAKKEAERKKSLEETANQLANVSLPPDGRGTA